MKLLVMIPILGITTIILFCPKTRALNPVSPSY